MNHIFFRNAILFPAFRQNLQNYPNGNGAEKISGERAQKLKQKWNHKERKGRREGQGNLNREICEIHERTKEFFGVFSG